jgi:hypothetical protein
MKKSLEKKNKTDKNLQEQLYAKYPSIFVQKDLLMSETCMCWGIEPLQGNSGWYDLIDKMCQLILDNDPNKKIQATQIKEKFGGLRFYLNGYPSEEFYRKFNALESSSYKICEVCGKLGKLRNKIGWYMTRCNDCWKKEEKK